MDRFYPVLFSHYKNKKVSMEMVSPGVFALLGGGGTWLLGMHLDDGCFI
jgi:hypothetical protein